MSLLDVSTVYYTNLPSSFWSNAGIHCMNEKIKAFVRLLWITQRESNKENQDECKLWPTWLVDCLLTNVCVWLSSNLHANVLNTGKDILIFWITVESKFHTLMRAWAKRLTKKRQMRLIWEIWKGNRLKSQAILISNWMFYCFPRCYGFLSKIV